MNNETVKLLVGEKIREYRTHLKLSQMKLGDMVGINQRQIALIECGKSLPSLTTLIKLSKVFECDIDDFFKSEIAEEELKRKIFLLIDSFGYKQLKTLYEIIKQLRFF